MVGACSVSARHGARIQPGSLSTTADVIHESETARRFPAVFIPALRSPLARDPGSPLSSAAGPSPPRTAGPHGPRPEDLIEEIAVRLL